MSGRRFVRVHYRHKPIRIASLPYRRSRELFSFQRATATCHQRFAFEPVATL